MTQVSEWRTRGQGPRPVVTLFGGSPSDLRSRKMWGVNVTIKCVFDSCWLDEEGCRMSKPASHLDPRHPLWWVQSPSVGVLELQPPSGRLRTPVAVHRFRWFPRHPWTPPPVLGVTRILRLLPSTRLSPVPGGGVDRDPPESPAPPPSDPEPGAHRFRKVW